MSRIVVTGLGTISALGSSVDSNRVALIDETCGLSHLSLFKTRYSDTLRFGEIKTENKELEQITGISQSGVTRTILLAVRAADEAIQDSGFSVNQLANDEFALVCASTVGGMCLTDELYLDSNRKQEGSAFLSSYDCGSVALFMRERYGIKGVVNTINTACSSSANAIMYGARLIINGYAKRAIVGGVDSLAKFTINGFNSLGILAPQNCMPFDKNRNGLNLGEGAGFMILEREDDAAGKKIYASLSGFSNTNDAFHPSSLSDTGEGPFLAMKGSLEMAGLAPDEIGYINTHGTGTENNDEVESRAMKRVFKNVPPFASTKSKIGHTLGASAAVEAIFSILALHYGEMYPSLNFKDPIESTGLHPLKAYRKENLEHVMSNSFGFGGNCASLVFSRL